jgi:DNA-binding transcriptional MerR regulator
MNGINTTKAELETMLLQFKNLLENPTTQGVVLLLCDNNQTFAQQFIDSNDGLGIGEFSEMAAVSLETVRHWVEIGLLDPHSLNGKFKFLPPNLLELRSVQQWQKLGLTLEEIKKRKATGTIFIAEQPFSINGEELPHATIQIQRDDNPEAQKLLTQTAKDTNFVKYSKEESEARGLNVNMESIKLDYDAQILKLEQKQLDLQNQLENAKNLRAKLEITPVG